VIVMPVRHENGVDIVERVAGAFEPRQPLRVEVVVGAGRLAVIYIQVEKRVDKHLGAAAPNQESLTGEKDDLYTATFISGPATLRPSRQHGDEEKNGRSDTADAAIEHLSAPFVESHRYIRI
jgi:hypothetical protein